MSEDKKTLAHQIYFIPEQNFRLADQKASTAQNGQSIKIEPERIRVLKCYLEEAYLDDADK
jgi:hypothetical protein